MSYYYFETLEQYINWWKSKNNVPYPYEWIIKQEGAVEYYTNLMQKENDRRRENLSANGINQKDRFIELGISNFENIRNNEDLNNKRIKNLGEGVRNSKKHKSAAIKNISKARNNPKTKEAAIKGSKEKVTCPHCGKIGSKSGMKSWHFDRCKENPNRTPRNGKNPGEGAKYNK